MKPVIEALERTPVIAATDRVGWQSAVLSDAEVLFHLGADIITVSDDIKVAKQNGKFVFIHIDLADGIGKDKTGEPYLQRFRQGLGQFVLRVQLAGKDLAYILQEQKIV